MHLQLVLVQQRSLPESGLTYITVEALFADLLRSQSYLPDGEVSIRMAVLHMLFHRYQPSLAELTAGALVAEALQGKKLQVQVQALLDK